MFSNYLKNHQAKKNEEGKSNYTHTRIGDKKKIEGGSYHIPDEEWEEFMELYYQNTITNCKLEYLTEKQLDNGAIMVDFDFRYEKSITRRQHTPNHIIDMMMIYVDEINKILEIPKGESYNVYIMEKADVNKLVDITKDGIHAVFCINMERKYQKVLRKNVMPRLKEMWDDIPTINTYDDVIDKAVVNGTANWQVYGSRKPANQAYHLKHLYTITDDEFSEEVECQDWSYLPKKNFFEVSARNKTHKTYPVRKEAVIKDEVLDSGYNTPTEEGEGSYKPKLPVIEVTETDLTARLNLIKMEYWDKTCEWRQLIQAIGSALPYDEAFKIAVEYSKKSTKWDRDSEELIKTLLKGGGYSMGTINYYAKVSNPVGYKNLISQDTTIADPFDTTDYGRAKLYLSLIGDDFQYKDNKPYIYQGRLWKCDNDKEQKALCKSIQDVLIDYYSWSAKELTNKIANITPEDVSLPTLKWKHTQMMDSLFLVKSTNNLNSTKKQVLIHAEECNVRFDMVKPYYFVFKNTAFDFENGTEIKVGKYDYITQSTNYNYMPPPQEDIDELMKVLSSSLPHTKKLKSFLSCLRTGCIGKRIQKFVMMTGRGRNGKGLINQLMKFLLGEYFYQGNINTITEKHKSGGNPEVANMNKKRMVCYGEPEDNQSLMLGAIKALTGEDTINARKLFENDTETWLLLTLFLEVNGKPNVCGKIGDAIKERFLLYDFPNLFTSDKSLINNINIFAQNRLYETTEWRERIRHALFYILLNLRDDNDALITDVYIPKEITDETNRYLEGKDELSNWFNEEYVIVDDATFKLNIDTHHITIKDMYSLFKESEMYNNSSKQNKRVKYSKKGFEEEAKENIKLKPYYVETKTIEKVRLTNSFIRMRRKTDEEKAEDKGEEIEKDNID